METQPFSEDLRRYVALLWHWAWLLVLATILAGAVAYIVSKQMTPIFQASTTILVNGAPATQSTDYSSILSSERLTQTYSQLLTKQPILEGVIKRLGINIDVGVLKKMVQVQPVRDTQLIEVRVQDTNPDRAARIANAIFQEFANQNQALQATRYAASKQSLETQLDQMDQQIQKATADLAALSTSTNNQNERDRLETTLAQYRQTYAALLQSYESIRLAEANSTSNVVQAEPASPPARPIKPRVLTNTLLAAVVGLLLAVGIAFLVEAMDDTIRNPGDVTHQLGLPVLGAIAKYDYEDDNPITTTQPRAPVAEAFRSLRTNIQFASVDTPLRSILVTSPSPADGKSTVAVNLGVVLAQSGRKVVILDADLHRPKIHKIIRLANRRGLSDLFVQNQVNLDGAVQKTEIQNYYALTSGSLPPNPSELLGSGKMVDIIHQLEDQAELVIIDTPPLLAVTDACVLAPRVDGVLLIIKPGVTKLAACKQAVEQLRHVGAKILGVVLNEIEIKRSRYYYYHYRGYYYAYYDSYGESPSGNNHKSKIGNGKAKSKDKNPR